MSALFEPVNDDHAIERVSFVLRFTRSFTSEEVVEFRRSHRRWATELPALREVPGFTLMIDAEGPRVEPMSGVEFAFSRPDGSSVWAFRVVGNDLVVECTRYTRWAKVGDSARKHLVEALSLLEELESPPSPSKVLLNVVDAFTATDADADTATVLNDSDLIPAAAKGFGRNWHSHTGWFEGDGSNRVLHNLNIDTGEGEGEDAPAKRLSILHVLSIDVCDMPIDALRDALAGRMETLHQANKTVMAKLLKAEMADRIKLGVIG